MSNPNNADVVTSRIPLHWMLEPRQLDPFSEVPVKNTIDNAINAMLVYLDDRVGAGPVRDRAQDKLQEAAFLATRAIVQAGVMGATRGSGSERFLGGDVIKSYEEEIRGLKAQLDTEIREAAALRERNRFLSEEVEALVNQRDTMSKDMHDQVGIIRALQDQTDEYADFIRTLKARLEELRDLMTGKTPSQPTSPSSGFVHPATVPITVRGKPWDISREEVVRGGLEEALTEAMNEAAQGQGKAFEPLIHQWRDESGAKHYTLNFDLIVPDDFYLDMYCTISDTEKKTITLCDSTSRFGFVRKPGKPLSEESLREGLRYLVDPPAYSTAHIKPE